METKQVSVNAPAAGDYLLFKDREEVSDGVTTRVGSGEASTDDMPNVTFGWLDLRAASTVYLSVPLTVKNAYLASDTIQSSDLAPQQTLTVDPGQGGFGSVTIANLTLKADLVLKAGVTTTISPGPSVLVGKADNYGTVNWAGGDVTLGSVLTNQPGATFTVQGDNQLLTAPLVQGVKVVNQGTFQKTVGAANAQTLIDMPFETSGYLWQFTGTLSISGTLTQTGANSVTGLYQNATLKAPTFSVSNGQLYGAGDFYGDLTNDAWLHPGMQMGLAATLTIHGNYTQTANGTLYVEVVGVGLVGTLNVVQQTIQQNNAGPLNVAQQNVGGTATVGGTVKFHRSPNFFPGQMSVDFVLASTTGLGQGFNFITDPRNDVWNDPNGVQVSFASVALTAAGIGYFIR
jgi:hypothetical protein